MALYNYRFKFLHPDFESYLGNALIQFMSLKWASPVFKSKLNSQILLPYNKMYLTKPLTPLRAARL